MAAITSTGLGSGLDINGMVTNPRLKAPLDATAPILSGPKNTKAAGITMHPPSITSANSFMLTADNPDNTTSSPFER